MQQSKISNCNDFILLTICFNGLMHRLMFSLNPEEGASCKFLFMNKASLNMCLYTQFIIMDN